MTSSGAGMAAEATDGPVQVRAQATRELVAAGQLDYPYVALSYVVWPTARLEALPMRYGPERSGRPSSRSERSS